MCPLPVCCYLWPVAAASSDDSTVTWTSLSNGARKRPASHPPHILVKHISCTIEFLWIKVTYIWKRFLIIIYCFNFQKADHNTNQLTRVRGCAWADLKHRLLRQRWYLEVLVYVGMFTFLLPPNTPLYNLLCLLFPHQPEKPTGQNGPSAVV